MLILCKRDGQRRPSDVLGGLALKKSIISMAVAVLAFSACADDAVPGFDTARYVLVQLAGKPLPNGPAASITIADTLVISPSQRKAQQTLIYSNMGTTLSAVTELGLVVTDRGYAVDFHCVAGQVCIAIYSPDYGTVRGDTLQFVHADIVTRKYVRR